MNELSMALFAVSDTGTAPTEQQRDAIHDAAVICDMLDEVLLCRRGHLNDDSPISTLMYAKNMHDALTMMKDRLNEAIVAATTQEVE